MKTILFIEDRRQIYRNFAKLLNTRIDLFKLMVAPDVPAASEMLSEMSVDVILAGTHLDAADLEVLDRQRNGARLIVPAVNPSPVANLLKTLEYEIRFDLPVDTSLLLDMLLKAFDMDYGGQMHGVSLSSFLQMIELEGATCRIRVVAGKTSGHLFFDRGDLIGAEKDSLKGKAAALDILSMEDPLISVDYIDQINRIREIRTPLMSLLIEAARIQDEVYALRTDKRRYKRFECALSTLFDSRNVAYKGTIRNISLDGIYIETGHTFFAGQDICVTLFSQSLKKGCRIGAMVVRKKKGGIGLQFSELSMNQKRIVRLVMEEIQCARQQRNRPGKAAGRKATG